MNDTAIGSMLFKNIILEWTTSLDTSSSTLFVREGGGREGGREGGCQSGCPRHVERRVT